LLGTQQQQSAPEQQQSGQDQQRTTLVPGELGFLVGGLHVLPLCVPFCVTPCLSWQCLSSACKCAFSCPSVWPCHRGLPGDFFMPFKNGGQTG
jgi:hypothetical protein